jgi:hypothetical protein
VLTGRKVVLKNLERWFAPQYRWLWVLAVSGVLGFRVGIVGFPSWQVAVETAQVTAGLVDYPPGSPFYVYHTKIWTILHQVCALLLLSGLSEITVSLLVSGLLGMVGFQALSMLVYALSRDTLVSIGAAFLIFFSRAASEYGVTYPIVLLGWHHTYGSLGLSYVVLVAGLLGAGAYRSGGFLLGLAPAIHPSLGFWFWLTSAPALAWDARTGWADWRSGAKSLIAGVAAAGTSLAVHLSLAAGEPPAVLVETSRYLSAFVTFWDGHRAPIAAAAPGVQLNIGVLALSLVALAALPMGLPRAARLLLRILAVTSLVSLLLVLISWIPASEVPAALLIMMPGRLLNVGAMAFAALILGLVAAYRTAFVSQLCLAVLTMGLVISDRSLLWNIVQGQESWIWQHRPDQFDLLKAAGLVMIGAGVVLAALRRAGRPSPDRAAKDRLRVATMGLRGLTLTTLVFVGVITWRLSYRPPELYRDWTNDPFFAAVANERRGFVVTGGSFQLLQLVTRRPVLIDSGGLDALPYALETGPRVDEILREVYGLDFFHPPPEAKGGGVVPALFNKGVWERYSRSKWEEIGRRFDVTQVVTSSDWNLDLPVSAQSQTFRLRLYEIPR